MRAWDGLRVGAANLSKPYSKALVRFLVLLLLMANIINLGADISAMGTALQLVIGGNVTVYAILFGRFLFCFRYTFRTENMFIT